MDWVGSRTPGLDVLVHSAGSVRLGNIETVGREDLDAEYRVNLRAPFLLTKALLPLLKASTGQVVFVNSTAGLAAGPDNGLYAATKMDCGHSPEAFATPLNPHGIRVPERFSGRTATPMQGGWPSFEKKTLRPEELLQPGRRRRNGGRYTQVATYLRR